ncbi:MAG: UDP-N-acetylmuramoyl-tripeptide--D-alanyl-D-alanine ligase [Candidatus Protistobacter heckmanni]|nr:UDP-N-acetylmuramoyl-tripeptide--D-alanyl-D-alanine ligase [Candidatus Protistobacter heckmanni]
MMQLREAAAAVPGSRVVGAKVVDAAGIAFSRVCTDSRAVQSGDLFIALVGERFDAHDFLAEVAAQGAAAVMVSRLVDACPLPQLLVEDTRVALGMLAHAWRERFSIPVAAVTGSNGKTTVKEMLASIFAAQAGEEGRLATAGNFNNDIGLPLTLLRLREGHKLAAIEMGMNHPGETASLAAIAAPTIGLINNAQREHQEFMETVEAVAREHADLLRALPADGVAVFPADEEYSALWREAAAGRKVLDFALRGAGGAVQAAVTGDWQADADGLTVDIDTPEGNLGVRLSAFGAHNARNALAATAAALAAGVSLEAVREGLENFTPVKGRLQRKAGPGGAVVVDDTYNANPDSVRAAIDVLAAMPAPRALILGDMGEVGSRGDEFHAEVGAYAKARGIQALLTVGPMSRQACEAFGAGATHFLDMDVMLAALPGALRALTGGGVNSILVKGSRFMRMERAVESLCSGATKQKKE